MTEPLAPSLGDYVLATKYSDGDPGDNWALGFYTGTDNMPGMQGRHFVKDNAGNNIRGNGYRRVGRITVEIGNWLWENRDLLERAPSKISLWGMYDWEFVNERIADSSPVLPQEP